MLILSITMHFRLITLGLLLTAPAADVLALSAEKSVDQYVRVTWRAENGLPQSHVNAVAQSSDGYVWAATQAGLARFDGQRFVIFDKSGHREMVSNYALTLIATRKGELYAGTTAGLMRISGEKIETFTTANGLPNNVITALVESRDGSVWIGTAGGVARLAGNRVSPFRPSELPHARVTALSEDWSGRIWIGTMNGLASHTGGQFSRHGTADGFREERILALAASSDGGVWIGSASGLRHYRAGEFRNYGDAHGLRAARVSAVYEDRTGAIWIGTLNHGLGRLRDDRVELEPFADYSVSSFLEDREGNLWVATSSGLTRLADGAVISFSAGLIDEDVKSVHGDRSGTIWAGTGRGLQTLDGSDLLARRDGLSSSDVLCAMTARDGSQWIGTSDGGLNHVRDGRVRRYGRAEGLPSQMVISLYEDRRGQIWVGTAGGLARVAGGEVQAFPAPLSGQIVGALLEDREGVLWAGTQDGGLNRIAGSRVDSFTTRNGLTSDFILALHQDSSGAIWIGTAGGGVSRFKDGKFVNLNSSHGLLDDNVFAILEDDAGNLWMSCTKGVFRAGLREMHAVADGADSRVRTVVYGHGDGMKSSECKGGAQPVAWKTPDGKLWFATRRGVAMINPAAAQTATAAFPVVIEEIYADGKKLPAGASVEPGVRNLEVQYTSPTFKAPEKVTFQYMLEGFDDAWVDAGTRRAAYYTNLPPGRYEFRVRAGSRETFELAPVSTAALSVKPFFYQTYWFWAVVALAVMALVWSAHRWRVQVIRASAERFKVLFERNLAGVYRATAEGEILDCNAACAKILGFSTPREMTGYRIFDAFARPEDAGELMRHLRKDGGVSTFETALRRSDGEPIWVVQNVNLAAGQNGEILEATLFDVTDRKRADERIRFQAYHDALTELPNRALFKDRLSLALAHGRRHGTHVAVLFLDLDRFKLINDTFGHTVGDHLLQGMAERLEHCVRREDSVARVGGDEFTVLVTDVHGASDATRVAGKVLQAVARPIVVDGHELYVTSSIGIAISPSDGDDAETLLKNADNALYRAKESSQNSYQLCTPSMNRLAAERLLLENALRQALDRNEFLLHYQPQFDTRSREVIGVEALLRWERPEKGVVSPGEFMSAAEESRLIIPIGEWVLRAAAQQARNWDAARFPLRVSVNVSAAQFQHRQLVQTIRDVLDRSGVDPLRLEVEITESTAMQNPDLTAGILHELKSLGISVVIDDFGIGHSSLNYLKRFPIDGLKIDKSFVRDVSRGDSDAAIVSAVIAMARALRLRVTAEGVETEEQLRFLESHGCHEIQGHLLSRPLPGEAVTEMLRRQSAPGGKGGRFVPAVINPPTTDH
jgi:diguanylate cyclase (GGDEF)-like protein/PAS domain S-box-containing protein